MSASATETAPEQSGNGHRMPVYFVSHGGPNLLADTEYPADQPIARGLRQIGDDIRALHPRGMVVISGHWESNSGKRGGLQVNGLSATPQPLIYDFYGFPPHMYRETFEHKVDPKLTQQVAGLFAKAGVPIDTVDRGLDHGVWVVLKKAGLAGSAFPIVQLSLLGTESMDDHLRVGEILAPLRDQGVVIVGSGMAVHNLRDLFGSGPSSGGAIRPYVKPFDMEVDRAVIESAPDARRAAMVALASSDNLRKAHPTLEHLLPLHVAVGAAGYQANTKKMLEAYQLSVSWSCYKME
ncbi:hypothetical protein GGI11_006727 [Coemansia sp. RSA 2049]|nr:hypothetical protein GGI11_006727 [Coemansia sp. RSA 2049]KAJ2510514.1 hypothetical protein H4217_007836 [Coemansia sp. RSA 1939]KAJ2609892.1 hypothetical protein EV177_004242 [Coemansia sp. RSA 1804]